MKVIALSPAPSLAARAAYTKIVAARIFLSPVRLRTLKVITTVMDSGPRPITTDPVWGLTDVRPTQEAP
jgi:hypothetical protein